MSVVVTIWKWSLAQTIFDGYPLIEHLISFNETHILDVDDVGVVGVKRK
jgi:hypothetical protein